jgi:MFS transporter, AAHS family, 4-hydroxybenzoate transporter
MCEWGVSREAFAPVVAEGLVGMAAGSAVAGYIGDRLGRRNALIASVALFGVATCAIGLSPNLLTIGILRFVAGLGIGGTLPSATTLAAEFTPLRRRAVTVTATIVCFPFGGMIAGLYAAYIMPAFGWRGLFLIGGIVPVAFALALIAVMPESPRYLAHHVGRWKELVHLLRRTGRSLPEDAAFTDRAEHAIPDQRVGFGALFEGTRARDTLALWVSFFACLFAVYTAFSWLPAMLIAQGFAGSVAGAALTAYNFGGVFGALVCAVAITRFGSRWPWSCAASEELRARSACGYIRIRTRCCWSSVSACTGCLSTRSIPRSMRSAPSCIRRTYAPGE